MILALLVLVISMFDLSAQTSRPVDICELFREPAHWNGLMIKVRAPIEFGHGEGGPWLSGKHCKTMIEVKGTRFPNLIAFQDPQDGRFRLHAVNFHFDEAALNRFLALQSHLDRNTKYIEATVTGMFETRVPPDDLIRKDRPYVYNGFGDQNAAPAQILLKTITEMRINPSTR